MKLFVKSSILFLLINLLNGCLLDELEEIKDPIESLGSQNELKVLANLNLWLDASDASSISINGGLVESWSDKSGNNNNALQSVLGNRPSLKSNGLNNLPVIDFDGADDFLRVADDSSLKPAELTIFVVGRSRTVTNGYEAFINKSSNWSNWDDGYGLNALWNSTTTEYQFWVDNYWDSVASDYQNLYDVSANNEFKIWGGRYDGSISSFWIDGVEVSTTNVTAPINHSSRAMTIGSSYLGTVEATVDQSLDGEIAEILIYGSALSDSDRIAVEEYLRGKWNL